MKTLRYISLAAGLFLAACNQPAQNKSAEPGHEEHTITASSGYADSINAGLISDDTLKGSPERRVMADVNDNHIHIEYNSPGVKGRIIWGGLVPFDKVWVTGAHKATRISFSQDVEIDGHKIEKGIYAFFTIPAKDNWTIILNRNYEQHLADNYDAGDDIIRIQVKPQAHAFTPRLTYTIEPLQDKKILIHMAWEKISIALPLKNL